MAPLLLVLLIFLASSVLTIFLILKKPYVDFTIGKKQFIFETYYFGALAGAAVIIALGLLSNVQIWASLSGDGRLNPLGILVLFLSMAFISIFLDSTGFFEYCARLAIKHAGKSGIKLFIYLYATVSALTVFTSNDIIILTFTPFIYYFAKNARIDPKPFLIAEFFAANTWSMMIYIGNPTNIVVASAYGIKFFQYLKWMFLPTLISGLVNILVIYLLFRKSISSQIRRVERINPADALKDRSGAALGVSLLALCIIVLSIAPYFNFQMWEASLGFAIILALTLGVRKLYYLVRRDRRKENIYVRAALKRMPWSVVPFVLSLFIIVAALNAYGVTTAAGAFLSSLSSGNIFLAVLIFGITSTLAANFMNNIPMTVAFVSVISVLSGKALLASAFAVTIGSNLGANLTPIGALAGIMWMNILKDKEFKIGFFEFVKYGAIVTAATLLSALLVLGLEFLIV